MAALTLDCLGALDVRVDGQLVTDFAIDKAPALLVYLALEPDRPHSRPSLVGLLWPDLSQEAALTNLRMTLYRLRQTLDYAAPGLAEALLTTSRQTLHLNSDAVKVDVRRLEALVAITGRHAHPSLAAEHIRRRLEQARGMEGAPATLVGQRVLSKLLALHANCLIGRIGYLICQSHHRLGAAPVLSGERGRQPRDWAAVYSSRPDRSGLIEGSPACADTIPYTGIQKSIQSLQAREARGHAGLDAIGRGAPGRMGLFLPQAYQVRVIPFRGFEGVR